MESRLRLGGVDMLKFRGLVLPAAMLAGGAAPGAPAPVPHAPERYGLAPEQSVEVCRPEGQRRYLARHLCPAGEQPAFELPVHVDPRPPRPPALSPHEQE